MVSSVPAPIQTLLDLFATSLADVRFADLDGATLAACATGVDAAAEAVAAAQSVLDAARAALQQQQDTLLQHAQRALGYARVYAEGDEALSGQLDSVNLPRGTRRPRTDDALVLSAEPLPSPRPRGRPRKAPASDPIVESMALPAAE